FRKIHSTCRPSKGDDMTNIPQTAVGVQICIQLFVDFITFHRNQFTLGRTGLQLTGTRLFYRMNE
ncbi:MAG: hypothetical protein KKB20_09790, partial [Proteobacteria bacterium]|nr:hypothetical protein [Pseudomonadota bacterium]